jgi:hypothetical protein
LKADEARKCRSWNAPLHPAIDSGFLESLTFQVSTETRSNQSYPIQIRQMMKRSIRVVKKKAKPDVKVVVVDPKDKLTSIRSWVEEFRQRDPTSAILAFKSLFKE